MGLIVSRLLGLRTESGNTVIDPVIAHSLTGLSASIAYMGHSLTLKYVVKENTYNPKRILVNGKTIDFTYEDNKYRLGGAVIATEQLLTVLNQKDNFMEVHL